MKTLRPDPFLRHSASWNQAGLGEAPPPFQAGGRRVVPIEMAKVTLGLEIDVSARTARGRCVIEFRLSEKGFAMLDLVPAATALTLNGTVLPAGKLLEVAPPGGEAPVRVLDVELESEPGGGRSGHELVIEYALSSDSVKFIDGGVTCSFFMTDLNERGYWERHAPANLEFDQTPMEVTITVANAATEHRLFTNGEVEQAAGTQSWKIAYPDYFTCSSPYLHLTGHAYTIRTDEYSGAERIIPITVYGPTQALVDAGLARAKETLRELEQAYGPYAHAQLTIFMTEDGGGMEYCGATVTSLWALAHELTHSWFARGVMPANGNAGWLDEAIASWRDNGYPTATPDPNRDPVNLAGFSPYRRYTPRDAYTLGALFLSELDSVLQPGGLRPILRKFFLTYRRKVITTPMFEAFVETESGLDLTEMFRRFVFGIRNDGAPREDRFFLEGERPELTVQDVVKRAWGKEAVLPPRPFTRAELRELR